MADMAGESNLEETMRRCIREELSNNSSVNRANNSGVSNSNQTLVGQTRELIRSSASFASRQLSKVTGGLPRLNQSPQQVQNRSLPSHSLRFPKRKQNVAGKNNAKKGSKLFRKQYSC